MSNLPFQQKPAANMEMQERPQNMGWPLMNGATHHSLPPIAAITSCRPSSTPVQLLRNTKDEHVFTAPGQLRQPQPATARAPTPFPDLPLQRSLGLSANPDNVPSPKLPSVPTKSAFAVVGSPFSPKEGAISSPVQELKSPGAETVGECNTSELGPENNVTPYQSQSLNSLEYPKASQENSSTSHNNFLSIGNNSEQVQGEQTSSDCPLTNQRSIGFPAITKPTSNYTVNVNSSSKSPENVTVREINVKAQDSDFDIATVVKSNITLTSSGNTPPSGDNVTTVNLPPSSGEMEVTVITNSPKSIENMAPLNISNRGVEDTSCVKTIMSPRRDESVATDDAPPRSVENMPPVNENMPSRTVESPVNANLPPRSAEDVAGNTSERHGHLYTSMSNSDKPTHHNMNSYNNLGPFERKSETAMQMANAAYLDAVSKQSSNITTSAAAPDLGRQISDSTSKQPISVGHSAYLDGNRPSVVSQYASNDAASIQSTNGTNFISAIQPPTPTTSSSNRETSSFEAANKQSTPTGNAANFDAAIRQHFSAGNSPYLNVASRQQPATSGIPDHYNPGSRQPTPTGNSGHSNPASRQPGLTINTSYINVASRQPSPSAAHFDSTSRQPTPTGNVPFTAASRQPSLTGNAAYYDLSRQPTPTGDTGQFDNARRLPTPTGSVAHFDTTSRQPTPTGSVDHFDTTSRQPTPTGNVSQFRASGRQPTPTGNSGHYENTSRQPTPTGNNGHYETTSRQPTPTGNSGHYETTIRQPTPTGNSGHYEVTIRQPTPTGNSGLLDTASKHPNPSDNIGHLDSARRQPTPTGNVIHLNASNRQPTSTGNTGHFDVGNRHQTPTGNAGHFDTTSKQPTPAANVGHFIATRKQPTPTGNTGHFDAGSRQLNPTGNVAHYNATGRQLNPTGSKNAAHFDGAARQLTHMASAAHFNADRRQLTSTGNAAHFNTDSRQPIPTGNAAHFDAAKRRQAGSYFDEISKQLPLATSAGNASFAGGKRASSSSSASVSIPTSVINTAYFETMGKQANQTTNPAAYFDALGKQAHIAASAANTAHFGVANKPTTSSSNSYFEGRAAYFDAINKQSGINTPTSQAAYLAAANKQTGMPTTSSSSAYLSVANQASAAASAATAAYLDAVNKQGITASSGAYFDDVNKQKNLPLSHPYRFPVPGEYSKRPTGPRGQLPAQYHREMANRGNVPNVRQAFVDNRQLESMRQAEKSGHLQAQVANYPVTPHGDQHSIIRTANPLHHATSLPGNTFNSSIYNKQNPAHTLVSSTDRTQNRQIDRVSQEVAQRQANYPSKTSQIGDGKYYSTPQTNTPQNYKRPEPSNYPAPQQMSRQNIQSFAPPSQTKNNTAPQPSRPQQANQYYPIETSKQTWNVPHSNEVRTHGAVAPFTSKEMQAQSPLGAAQMHRSSTSHSQAYQSQINSRDRHHTYQQPSGLPRINPPAMVSLSSQSASRFSPHSSNTPTSQADHGPSTSPFSRLPSTSHSSSYSPTLPRVNFPSPVSASFTGASSMPARSECVTTVSSRMPISSSQYSQAYGKAQQGPSPQSRHAYSKMYPGAAVQETGSYPASYGRQTPETSFPQNTQVISRGNDSDVCRNPFELPVPTSNEKRIMKLNERHPTLSYSASPNDPKIMPPNSSNNYIPRSPVESYPNAEMRKKMAANAMFVPHNMFESPQESKSSNARPKQTVVSARFPPVPQSNFDLQRQIYDRMTGVQQAPPRLIAKQEKHQQVKNIPLVVPKRESPLDLSVKTVRQSADSTRDDIEMLSHRQPVREPRLASAPKIDFTPNFSDPPVRPGSHNATFLPPVHSIRKFQPPAPSQTPPKVLKRPLSESPTQIMAKIPKVDAWKVAMDEQIEERLNAARQMRHPEPLPPPPVSSSPAYDMSHEYKRENNKMSLPEATPELIIQQISQGVIPDTRFLQDRTVVDMLRSSLEEKEARLEQLQAAARKRPAERMCVPPSYPLPPPQSAQPIPIGVQSTQKYIRSPESDLDGLAALAARIRTKAEMKQMGPTSENLTDAVPIPITSPPKLLRENRPDSEQQQQPAPIPVPRDPGLRSSSETSVFDFRETDSENEMPVLERQTLDGMRRPRKTQPPPPSIHSAESDAVAPDPAWDNACEMFVEQLQKRPIKRSVRKKKPNPKFFTNESDTPQYMKVPVPDDFQVKQEPEEPPDLPMPEVNEDKTVIETTPSKAVKEEDDDESSSDDELPGVTVVKEGRIKLITRKQKPVASDSEWDSSVAELTSADESEASGSSSESSSEENSDMETRKTRSESNERTRRTRKCRTQGSDSDSAAKKRPRTRGVIASDSDSQSKTKAARPRTRTHPVSESDDQEESSEESEDERIRTRQQARSVRDSGRMRLRSKKGDAAFRPGWEEDVVKFKQQLRMPDRLISKPKKKESPKKTKNKSLKSEKEEVHSVLSRRGRFGGNMVSAGMRRSNKAVSNSKKHLNKGSKRMKLRRRFRSGLDYLRRKKKQVQKKEKEAEVPPSPAATPAPEPKRKVRAEASDISAEVKGWVLNKSAGETVLHRAARQGHAEVTAYCLETRRMDPSPRDYAGYTPLHEACSRGNVEIAKILLEYGANPAESMGGGIRPLHQAAENNHLEMVRLLLAYGADPQIATYTGQTALSLTPSQDIRDLILTHISDIHGEESYKWTFEGPASVFDPNWAVDPLANPPSPDQDTDDVELEVSRAMLPPLYRLQSDDTWVQLSDVMAYMEMTSEEQLLSRLPGTPRTSLTKQEFLEHAKPCSILSSGPTVPTVANNVTLLRYDDAVRKLLDVEVALVT